METTLRMQDDIVYNLEQVWDGLRAVGYDMTITRDDVFWPIVFMGDFNNSSGDYIYRYVHKDSIWITHNFKSPEMEFFFVGSSMIMACQEDVNSCSSWISIELTSEKSITVYNHYDKKTYILSK